MSESTSIKIQFPWKSILCCIVALIFYNVSLNPNTLANYLDPTIYNKTSYQLAIFGIVICFILWDIRQFYFQRKQYSQTIKELFIAKRQLQKKAHAYSGHSDKLKLFISERLLEYIQYDEKFLHFKNIASEVRHNGVICFDKVQTALDTAITMQEKGGKYSDLKTVSEDALSSMRYLWDLLDLSTTDNIALHIGNYLCECEEHYFQSLLQNNNTTPYNPTFKAHKVIASCLTNLIDDPEGFHTINKQEESVFIYSDPLIYIKLDKGIDLLGNENHLRLLVENLVNNAQFYLNKKHTAKTQKPIAIELTDLDSEMLLTIYNRGQHIKEENKDKIFQLGYSTRRKKDNHGKGLGLYFANSIAQGYEGAISFINIHNNADTYSIRIQLANDQVVTEIVETILIDTLPLINTLDSKDPAKQSEWKFSETIKSIEIFSKRHNATYEFKINDQESTTFTDPENPTIPSWSAIIKQRKRSSQLIFIPLDISGVKFQVNIPTAKSRLDYSDENFELAEEPSEEEQFENIMELENQYKN
jgi:signal transduction histidine kinase